MHCSYVSASVHSEAETLMIAIKRGLKYGKRRQIVPAHVAPLELWHVLFSPNTHELKASEYEYAEAQLLRWQISQLCHFTDALSIPQKQVAEPLLTCSYAAARDDNVLRQNGHSLVTMTMCKKLRTP